MFQGRSWTTLFGCAGAGLVMLLVLLLFANGLFGYVGHKIDSTQIGILTRAGKFVGVLGPGVYTNLLDWMADIENVNIAGIPFTFKDEEVLTSDMQRIGVNVSGTVIRPGIGEVDEKKWSTYRSIYTDNTQLLESLGQQTQQAMKVCVGLKTFADSAIGNNRNDLSVCIDTTLTALVKDMGIEIRNLVVPNIVIPPAVQKQLDELTAARNQTELANQNALLADAEAKKNLAIEQGKIRVEEGKNQELLKQKALSADLDRKNYEAQSAVIKIQKENELLTAQKEKEIAEVKKTTAIINAEAAYAGEAAKAKIVNSNPIYAAYLNAVEMAKSLANSNLVIVPAGTNPLMMFGNGTTTAPIVAVPSTPAPTASAESK